MLSSLFHKTTTARLMNAERAPYLLASFYTSTPPVMWYYDLRKMKDTTISLRDNEGFCEIGTKLAGGEFAVIANFEDRKEAEHALNMIQKAMMKKSLLRRLRGWAYLILVILLVSVLAIFLLSPAPEMTPEQLSSLEKIVQEKDTTHEKIKIQQGIPMNADSVLVPPAD